MKVKANHKNARISAQKARLVADMVRGKQVEDALNILTFSPQKAAMLVRKVMLSAIANAENNEQQASQQSHSSIGNQQGKVVLTMEDLSNALSEYGMNASRPGFYR